MNRFRRPADSRHQGLRHWQASAEPAASGERPPSEAETGPRLPAGASFGSQHHRHPSPAPPFTTPCLRQNERTAGPQARQHEGARFGNRRSLMVGVAQ